MNESVISECRLPLAADGELHGAADGRALRDRERRAAGLAGEELVSRIPPPKAAGQEASGPIVDSWRLSTIGPDARLLAAGLGHLDHQVPGVQHAGNWRQPKNVRSQDGGPKSASPGVKRRGRCACSQASTARGSPGARQKETSSTSVVETTVVIGTLSASGACGNRGAPGGTANAFKIAAMSVDGTLSRRWRHRRHRSRRRVRSGAACHGRAGGQQERRARRAPHMWPHTCWTPSGAPRFRPPAAGQLRRSMLTISHGEACLDDCCPMG